MEDLKNLKSKKGFTLIELLVVTAIMGFLAVISSQIVVSLIDSQEKNTAINEIRQNGDYVINLFERDVRSAERIIGSSCFPATSCNVANLTNPSGNIAWSCLNGANKIQRQGAQLLESNIEFSTNNCKFNPTTFVAGRPQLVTWTFELVRNRGTNNEVAVPFRTSVENRVGN